MENLLQFIDDSLGSRLSKLSGRVLESVDGANMDKTDSPGFQPAQATGDSRAVRHELNIPLRYRVEGVLDWQLGEAINMSESGLLFSSNEMLEIDSRVQITFQSSGTPMVQSSTRMARVVRRNLSNWPETRILFGAKFCH